MTDDQPPRGLFEYLKLAFQDADFLFVVDKSTENFIKDAKWVEFIKDGWEQGYVKLLFHTPFNGGAIYDKWLFPYMRLQPATVESFIHSRNSFGDLEGFKIRVASYNNAPRSIIYNDEKGKLVFGGFYMRFVRHFLAARNATFVPVFIQGSPLHCTKALMSEEVDICADALVQNQTQEIAVTHALRVAYANVMVAHAEPLHSYRYLMAPFTTTTWICLMSYISAMVTFLSLIHWKQCHRWIYSEFLLEAISSLLFSGFRLKHVQGHARYILFAVMFLAGFVYSTMYLGFLKSILISEVFEKQINTFEELVERNVTIMMDEYDRILSIKYNLPEMLWPIVQVVSIETLMEHRNKFDTRYAYVLFTDRMNLYDYAQQFLHHKRLRRIPIKILFIFSGIPMRKTWFLRPHLSTAWASAFETGLTLKLTQEAEHEAMRTGVLPFLSTESRELKPLSLDYFVMPAISLVLGYGMALISFLIELLIKRLRG
ncbi:LOW QUALITY PROTEIN: uncharacterized protein [Drosophila tropicalis]|uniref:LOW QUALITY PROTEIN: uncharacterized protein n=1 Tax=Drosophila tropicalis TaxID=46794 RepID=UPI0035AB7505